MKQFKVKKLIETQYRVYGARVGRTPDRRWGVEGFVWVGTPEGKSGRRVRAQARTVAGLLPAIGASVNQALAEARAQYRGSVDLSGVDPTG